MSLIQLIDDDEKKITEEISAKQIKIKELRKEIKKLEKEREELEKIIYNLIFIKL